MEERVQDVLPGGMAGDVPVPPHEVVAQGCGDGKVNTTDCYNVVWCVARTTGEKQDQAEGQRQVPVGPAAGVDQVSGQVPAEGVTGMQITSGMKENLMSCFSLKRRMFCEDFEKNIYEEKCENFDWKEIDDIFCEVNEKTVD